MATADPSGSSPGAVAPQPHDLSGRPVLQLRLGPRKLVPLGTVASGSYGKQWRCWGCAWRIDTPAVGPYGHKTRRAIMAQVKMAFDKHQCGGEGGRRKRTPPNPAPERKPDDGR